MIPDDREIQIDLLSDTSLLLVEKFNRRVPWPVIVLDGGGDDNNRIIGFG